tara:strand:- start:493 stop:1266 length:774 start_codon:yes stop_codon:yes gene_type:complete
MEELLLIKNFLKKKHFDLKIRCNDILFILSMTKTGSTSIASSIRESDFNGIIFHDHIFSYSEPKMTLNKKWKIQLLHKRAIKKGKPMKIISSIRYPIDRNISAFFHGFQYYCPEFEIENLEIEKLISLFKSRYPHHKHDEWLSNNILAETGINIYDTPLENESYSLVRHENFELLTLKIDLANELISKILDQFLNLEGIFVKNHNKSSNKKYKQLYYNFKSKIKFPVSFINTINKSKFCEHFFSKEFLEKKKDEYLA